MALNAPAGTPLVVWNRTPEKCIPLQAMGVPVAASVAKVSAKTTTVVAVIRHTYE
ncbi:hypothetical protein ACFFLM_06310 [Deinococcus oregonensis]|uniref:Uncharacterized protein n=1 Tax=Deinococcus oregonensis TaxID=1805970 RepID=A0ABV6AVP8_9DEIO